MGWKSYLQKRKELAKVKHETLFQERLNQAVDLAKEKARLEKEYKLQPIKNKLYKSRIKGQIKAYRASGALRGSLSMAQALGFGSYQQPTTSGKKKRKKGRKEYASSNYGGFGDYSYRGSGDHLGFDFNV